MALDVKSHVIATVKHVTTSLGPVLVIVRVTGVAVTVTLVSALVNKKRYSYS